MKALLLIALCIYISACEQTTTPSLPAGVTYPITSPIDGTNPSWEFPQSISGAEQEFRGMYKDQANPNNIFEVLSNGSMRGSIETTERYRVGSGYGMRNAVCTFAGNITAFHQFESNRFGVVFQLTQWSHYSSIYYAMDCLLNDGHNATSLNNLSFHSEKCVAITFNAPTGPKIFCKE